MEGLFSQVSFFVSTVANMIYLTQTILPEYFHYEVDVPEEMKDNPIFPLYQSLDQLYTKLHESKVKEEYVH